MRYIPVVLLFCATWSASAQPVEEVEATCTYDTCALRVEPGWLSVRLVRGPVDQAESVGRVGLFSSDLADIVQPVPAAYAYAREADRARMISALAIAAAGVGYYLVLSSTDPFDDSAAPLVGLGAALGLSIVGNVFVFKASRAQSRAIWEYNRAVAQ